MFKIKSDIRGRLYVGSAIITPVVAYLAEQGVLSSFWAGLWLVFNSAVLGLAKLNVDKGTEK